ARAQMMVDLFTDAELWRLRAGGRRAGFPGGACHGGSDASLVRRTNLQCLHPCAAHAVSATDAGACAMSVPTAESMPAMALHTGFSLAPKPAAKGLLCTMSSHCPGVF